MTSGMQITPLRRADIPELSQFLIGGFGVPATASFFSHEVLAWKYFDGPSGPSEDSTCSLIARSAGRIIGHIGICPRQFIVIGRRSDAGFDDARHRLAGLGCASRLGSLFDAASLCDLQDTVCRRRNGTGASPLSKVGLRAEAQARHLSQGAGTIPSLAYHGSGIIPQMGRNSQGRGVRLASAHTAGAADRRTAAGAYVHRRN